MRTVAIKSIEKRYAFGPMTEPWRLTDYLGGALQGGSEVAVSVVACWFL